MNSLIENPDTTARLFIGLAVPDKARETIHKSLRPYADYIEKRMPEKNWHITLVFLGDVVNHKQYLSRLLKPLPQPFLPAVSITHLGRGLQREHLWAYINPAPAMHTLKKDLEDRLRSMRFPIPKDAASREFVPHIRVANLFPVTQGIGIPDGPAATTFTAKEACLYQSHQEEGEVRYTIEGTIPLTP